MNKAEILGLGEKLADYTPCLSVGVCLCDRRVVDEVIAALRAIASTMEDDRG